MKVSKYIIWIAVFVALISTTRVLLLHQKQAPLYLVSKGEIKQTIVAVGQIEPYQITEIRSQISGDVNQLFVQDGDYVHKGEKLLSILPRPTPADLATAVANKNEQAARVNNASITYQRYKVLYSKGTISKQDMDNQLSNYKVQRANYQLTLQQLKLIKTGTANIDGKVTENVIESPTDGYILKVYVNLGDSIVPVTEYQPGTVLFVIADMKNLVFRGIVSQNDVLKLSNGMHAQVQLLANPNIEISGNLSKIALIDTNAQDQILQNQESITLFDTSNAYTNGYSIEIYPLNIHSHIKLRAGMQATATFIAIKIKNTIIIPIGLLRYQNEMPYVSVYKDRHLYRQFVKTGIADGSYAQVLSGLNAGDTIQE